VSGDDYASTKLSVSGDNNILQVTFNPPVEFELGQTVNVTLNVNDRAGNTNNVVFAYTIVLDTEPPVITVVYPSADAVTSTSITLKFRVTDDISNIDIDSIEIQRNGEILDISSIAKNISDKRLDAELDLNNLGYNQTVTISIKAKDIACTGSASVTISFRTEPDRIKPEIQALSPLPGAVNVPVNTVITINLIDNETEINNGKTYFRINGSTISLALNNNLKPIANNHYQITYTPSPNLLYSATYNIAVETEDTAGNTGNYIYSFRTEADTYPPAPPLMNIPGVTSINAREFVLSGNITEAGSLAVYANAQQIFTKNIPSGEFNIALNIEMLKQAGLAVPGSVVITSRLSDSSGNTSGDSAPLFLDIINKSFTSSQESSFNVLVPAGAFQEEVVVNVLPLTYIGYLEGLRYFETIAADISVIGSAKQLEAITIAMPLPSTGSRTVCYYNDSKNKWEIVTRTPSINEIAGTLSFPTSHLSIFALGDIINLNTTQISDYEIILAPNPVKLAQEPLHFVYKVPNSARAEVRIYALNGRLLAKFNRELSAGLGEFIWDGENNWNERIGNGVYLAYITLEDNVTGEKEIIRGKIAVLN
jgi:hypothetical protein